MSISLAFGWAFGGCIFGLGRGGQSGCSVSLYSSVWIAATLSYNPMPMPAPSTISGSALCDCTPLAATPASRISRLLAGLSRVT